ncbi:MAG: ABC transporter permease [Turicibacter sp.]|nr:ABC transporter permease [Turicibacter sp.]
MKNQNKSLIPIWIGSSILAILILFAAFGPMLSPFDPFEMNMAERFSPPGLANLMGTDEFGRDVFIRLAYGARNSLLIGFLVAFLSSLLGIVIGLYASYYKFLDHLLMRICDGLSAIPGILLAIALMAAMGPSVTNIVIALTVVSTPNIARIVRSGALVIKKQPYIEAVHTLGGSHSRIIWLNMSPAILPALLVQASFAFASAILSEASLSFLGAGISEPQPSWGSILQSSTHVIGRAWWLALFPGLLLVLSVLGLNLLGDGARDLMDVKLPTTKKGGR